MKPVTKIFPVLALAVSAAAVNAAEIPAQPTFNPYFAPVIDQDQMLEQQKAFMEQQAAAFEAQRKFFQQMESERERVIAAQQEAMERFFNEQMKLVEATAPAGFTAPQMPEFPAVPAMPAMPAPMELSELPQPPVFEDYAAMDPQARREAMRQYRTELRESLKKRHQELRDQSRQRREALADEYTKRSAKKV